jgi:hypothetical protein
MSDDQSNAAMSGTGESADGPVEQEFAALVGRPLSEFDPKAEYAVYYGGNFLHESESLWDPAWLKPAALRGEELTGMDHLYLTPGECEYPLSFDASLSLFEVMADQVPEAVAEALAEVSLYDDEYLVVRGRDLARVLERHSFDLTGPGPQKETWCLRLARIASDGTLLDALRAATGVERGPDGLIAHKGLHKHLRGFRKEDSHDLQHQFEQTASGDWDGDEEAWERIGTLVTQWLGSVDQYEVTVVRLP